MLRPRHIFQNTESIPRILLSLKAVQNQEVTLILVEQKGFVPFKYTCKVSRMSSEDVVVEVMSVLVLLKKCDQEFTLCFSIVLIFTVWFQNTVSCRVIFKILEPE
jgi:hypothetical protein